MTKDEDLVAAFSAGFIEGLLVAEAELRSGERLDLPEPRHEHPATWCGPCLVHATALVFSGMPLL